MNIFKIKEKLTYAWKNKKGLIIVVFVLSVLLIGGAIISNINNNSDMDSDGGIEDSMMDTDGNGSPDTLTEHRNKSGDSILDGGQERNEKKEQEDDVVGDDAGDFVDGCYEQWLSAGMVTGISMYYFENEFDIKGIYIASETKISNFKNSKGAYVVFTIDGKEKVLQSLPLEGERKDKGTIDLYARNFGYATFDEVNLSDEELNKCTEVKYEDLEMYINQLLLPTLYER